MPLPKIEDARKLSDEELVDEIEAVKKELFQLRLQKATSNLEKTHQFKHNRHRLAQLLTVERERQLADDASEEAKEEEVANEPEAAAESSEPEATSPEEEAEKPEPEKE